MKILYENTHYKVIPFANAMGEKGEPDSNGYAVVNKDTGVIEHTTIMLPGAIYQAQGFSDSLDALLKTDGAPLQLSLVDMPTDEDVVPN